MNRLKKILFFMIGLCILTGMPSQASVFDNDVGVVNVLSVENDTYINTPYIAVEKPQEVIMYDSDVYTYGDIVSTENFNPVEILGIINQCSQEVEYRRMLFSIIGYLGFNYNKTFNYREIRENPIDKRTEFGDLNKYPYVLNQNTYYSFRSYAVNKHFKGFGFGDINQYREYRMSANYKQ